MGQVYIDPRMHQRRGHHEDDQQDQHPVDVGHDVDVGLQAMLADAAAVGVHGHAGFTSFWMGVRPARTRAGRRRGSVAQSSRWDWRCMIEENSRSEEQPSELQSLMRISYAVFC